MSTPKYEVGQTVTVKHSQGAEWTGEITYRFNTGTGDERFSGWEYEVSNAPQDMTTAYPDMAHFYNQPGHRWYPLVWEEEIVEVVK